MRPSKVEYKNPGAGVHEVTVIHVCPECGHIHDPRFSPGKARPGTQGAGHP